MLTIINGMSRDDYLANEDDNHSISLMLAQSDCDNLWGLISDMMLQLQDCRPIVAEIREVMVLTNPDIFV